MIAVAVENEAYLIEIANILGSNIEDELQQVGKSMITKIKNRITRGENTAGSKMVSRSRQKIGSYSKMHGEARQERGLQVNNVDLQFDGKTMASFGIIEQSDTKVIGGFNNDEAGAIASKNEVMFGDAYVPNEQEIKEAVDELSDLIFKNISNGLASK